jgi:hypothetical protein
MQLRGTPALGQCTPVWVMATCPRANAYKVAMSSRAVRSSISLDFRSIEGARLERSLVQPMRPLEGSWDRLAS